MNPLCPVSVAVFMGLLMCKLNWLGIVYFIPSMHLSGHLLCFLCFKAPSGAGRLPAHHCRDGDCEGDKGEVLLRGSEL